MAHACLDCMLPGVQITTGLFFLCSSHLAIVIVTIVTPYFTGLAFFAGSYSGIVYYEIYQKINKDVIMKLWMYF